VKVVLVTTFGTACGIAEHASMLKEAVEGTDPAIDIQPYTSLSPNTLWVRRHEHAFDLVHLNYQAALLSQWTPDWIRQFRDGGYPVLVTFHDTGVPNSEQCRSVVEAATAAVVHEPFDDLPVATHYWRMGVPRWPGELQIVRGPRSWHQDRPILGSIGFPFPWKHYDSLARVTAEAGWALLLLAPGATDDQMEMWRQLNPHMEVRCSFVPRAQAIGELASCDATAFCYVCHNTGQSGAILQGIAARKPVIALSTCRQFRSLYLDDLGNETIDWCDTFERVSYALRYMSIGRVDTRIVALAEQESWIHLGQKYARLYRELIA
jgi:hypothetical protein